MGPDRLTVIVVPDERSPVRRYQLPRRWLVRAPWIAAAVLLALVLVVVDWVGLRLDVVDVERLRVEAERHRGDLAALDAQVRHLADDLERLREFERRVRVIANLPGAMTETRVPDAPLAGQGGPGEDEPAPGSEAAPPQSSAAAGPGPVSAGPHALFDVPRLAATRRRSAALVAQAAVQARSFAALVEGLRHAAARLEATPSIWPTEGWITSSFGPRTSPFTGRRQFHAALDIAARFGTEIVAPAKGQVAFVGRKGGLGRSVVIDHGHGIRTTYGHAAEVFVKRGQEVERGTPIAAVGSTGRSTGPHLHYVIEVEGKAVNPRDYILD